MKLSPERQERWSYSEVRKPTTLCGELCSSAQHRGQNSWELRNNGAFLAAQKQLLDECRWNLNIWRKRYNTKSNCHSFLFIVKRYWHPQEWKNIYYFIQSEVNGWSRCFGWFSHIMLSLKEISVHVIWNLSKETYLKENYAGFEAWGWACTSHASLQVHLSKVAASRHTMVGQKRE